MSNQPLRSARLITAFGTALYVDEASGEWRQGPADTSPKNALLLADPNVEGHFRRGRPVFLGDVQEPIVCGPEGCRTASRAKADNASAAPTLFELIPLERGLVALAADGAFLCAFPDGQVRLSARVCSTWELFLASEAWCAEPPAAGEGSGWQDEAPNVDRKRVKEHIVHPLHRARADTNSDRSKVLIYGYTGWSHGRVHYDLCTHLFRQGYIVDILDWRVSHSDYIRQLVDYYDLFMTALDGVRTLVDAYNIPYERIVAISHHEFDIRMLIEQKGLDAFDKFANYGVVSEFLYSASLMRGVQRTPKVAPLGINYSDFYSEVPKALATVGYASSMATTTYGVEWKRGHLAEAAARAAGLDFKVAGSTGNQTSFHDMPDFYRTVDAVLTSSISEAAQLPVMEAAAAGRLVIGTPVGHFPRKAYEGAGILAPIEAEKFTAFAAATLRYYKDNPAAYVEKCRSIQEAARKFDWQYSIGEWIELIDEARGYVLKAARAQQQAGRSAEAAALFAEWAERGGDAEERWYARWQEARCLRDEGKESGFVMTALEAFRLRPYRAEPLHDLARYYLGKSRGDLAIRFADAGISLPVPEGDHLGVEQEVYNTGLKEAFTIAASYSKDPEEKERGRAICNWLSLSREAPDWVRSLARLNYNWYADPARSLLPSIEFHPFSIGAPDGFKPGNVSIARAPDGLIILIRAVNYDLLESGYFDRHGDTSFRQRTLLARLDERLQIVSSVEVLPPEDMPPPQHTDSVGFEDPRPIIWRGELWCISSVRQLNPDGRAEMVLSRITRTAGGGAAMTDWRVLTSGMPTQWQKNWMPRLINDELQFIYAVDPTRILRESGDVLFEETAPIAVESFRGGSQAIPFDGGWLMVIHEWQVVRGRRRYFHRFIWLDADNRLRRLSRRFYFQTIASEFAAGLAQDVTGDRLIVSFATDDREPTLAIVAADDVRASLLDIVEHRNASNLACGGANSLVKSDILTLMEKSAPLGDSSAEPNSPLRASARFQ